MNKPFFILGFLLSIFAYFSDPVAEFFQKLGGVAWSLFSGFGIYLYPFYLAIFFVPILFIIAFLSNKIQSNMGIKEVFFGLLYGYIVSSIIFVSFALVAISQFKFTQ